MEVKNVKEFKNHYVGKFITVKLKQDIYTFRPDRIYSMGHWFMGPPYWNEGYVTDCGPKFAHHLPEGVEFNWSNIKDWSSTIFINIITLRGLYEIPSNEIYPHTISIMSPEDIFVFKLELEDKEELNKCLQLNLNQKRKSRFGQSNMSFQLGKRKIDEL